jgi:hypothetical protein
VVTEVTGLAELSTGLAEVLGNVGGVGLLVLTEEGNVGGEGLELMLDPGNVGGVGLTVEGFCPSESALVSSSTASTMGLLVAVVTGLEDTSLLTVVVLVVTGLEVTGLGLGVGFVVMTGFCVGFVAAAVGF